ncbi:hypothetical protein D3C76_1179610 [compost metagenome]
MYRSQDACSRWHAPRRTPHPILIQTSWSSGTASTTPGPLPTLAGLPGRHSALPTGQDRCIWMAAAKSARSTPRRYWVESWGSRRTRLRHHLRRCVPTTASLMATTGPSAVTARIRSWIRSPAFPPPANAPAPATCRRTTSGPTRTHCITCRVVVTTSCKVASPACPRPALQPIDWPTACRHCKPPAPNTSWSGCCPISASPRRSMAPRCKRSRPNSAPSSIMNW